MRHRIAISLAGVILTALAPLLSACYTTQGAGRDLQSAGKAVENSAEKNTPY
ncbi:MAG: entericidin A/B family lipoprotein, partial [Acetobacteraceae bacterium]|nr:entericidin A/B family lipoprotein [Acetobacteraceae bacterium]